MKNVIALVGLAALMAVPAAQANDADFAASMIQPIVATSLQNVRDLINWKVGDNENFNVTISSMPIQGTMVEQVTKDDGDGTLWFNETIDLTIQKESVDVQIRKSDATILQEIVNGQAQQVDNTPPKIISEDNESVTVPAGTFKAVHVVAQETEQGQQSNLEEWANPRATAMEGSIKAIITSQGSTITEELTSFHKN